jgi:hypothetical protein
MGMDDRELLEMALQGYKQKRQEIDGKIAELQARLGGQKIVSIEDGESAETAKPKRRKMSAAGKARIIAAVRKRWAAFHKGTAKNVPAKKAGVKPSKPKRKMSAARRAALVENLRKARAARASKKSAGGKVPF